MSKAIKKVTHSTLGKVALAGGASLLAPGLGTALSGGLGLGLGAAGQAALGGGILGAGAGALEGGGLKGATLGGALGGAGGYLSNGGSLGSVLGSTGSGNLASATNSALSAGGGAFGPATASALGSAGYTAPSGILGSGIGKALTGAGGGGSSYSSVLSPIASTALGSYSNSKATDQLVAGQNKALGLYNQFANEKFTPTDLSQSPGYQFQLQQGQQAIDRKNAATGGYYSGAALKDAAQYAQGLADTTANEQYQQWLSTQAQKLNAVQNQAGLTEGIGASQATGTLNQGQLLGQGVSGVLGGLTGKYYNPSSGTFYNPQAAGVLSGNLSGLTAAQLQALRSAGLA